MKFSLVQEFVRDANRVESFDALSALMAQAVDHLGFDHFALVHNVMRRVAKTRTIQLTSYPQDWVETIAARAHMADDPVVAACQRSAAGFVWDDLPNLIQLTPRQMRILADARHAGLGAGFTQPINIPGEYAGSCSFVMRGGRALPVEVLPQAQYVGCFAFEAARRLMRLDGADFSARDPVVLTPRQMDCVVLVAQGKSDTDIAALLGLSRETVHHHVEAAKRKYDVATRTQMVVRALFESTLTFNDVVH